MHAKPQVLMKQTSPKMLKFKNKKWNLFIAWIIKQRKVVWKKPIGFGEIKNKQKWQFWQEKGAKSKCLFWIQMKRYCFIGFLKPTETILHYHTTYHKRAHKSRFSSISNLPQGRWAGFCRERKCSDNKTGASSLNGDQRCTEMAGPRGCGRSATTVCYNPRFLRCGPQMGKSQAKWRQTRFFTSGCLLTNESALVNFQELNYTLTILTVYLPRFFFPLESYLLVSHWTSVLSRAEFEKCCHNCLLINTEKWIRQILMAADQRHPHLFNVFDKRVTSNFSFQLWS